MTENQFDELWQQVEARKYGRMLAAGYPAWKRNRKRALTVAAMLLIVLVTAVVTVSTLQRPSASFEKVYCNRVGTSDSQWVALAAEMLME